MKKYIDEKLLVTLIAAFVITFFLEHLLTKKFIKDGAIDVHIGTPTTGYAKVN